MFPVLRFEMQIISNFDLSGKNLNVGNTCRDDLDLIFNFMAHHITGKAQIKIKLALFCVERSKLLNIL